MAQWAAVPYRPCRASHAARIPSDQPPDRAIAACRRESESAALVDGLFAPSAAIPPKYFYDALGCALFDAICELPEYYLTRTERGIYAAHRETIAAVVAGQNRQFIDLGAGNCAKGESWIAALQPRRYHRRRHRGGGSRAGAGAPGAGPSGGRVHRRHHRFLAHARSGRRSRPRRHDVLLSGLEHRQLHPRRCAGPARADSRPVLPPRRAADRRGHAQGQRAARRRLRRCARRDGGIQPQRSQSYQRAPGQ